MFNAVSWSQYGCTVFLLLVIYYTYVLAVYYRPEISALLKNRRGPNNPQQDGFDTRTPATLSSLHGASLIVPSIVVAPAVPRTAETEQPIDNDSEPAGSADTVDTLAEEAAPEQPGADSKVEEAAVEAKASQTPEVVETSSLIGVAQLHEFIDQVKRGEFTAEQVDQVPAGLENTTLLQNIFTASLARRRASLAVLEQV